MSQITSLGGGNGGTGVLTVNGGNNITSTNPNGPVVSLNLTGTTQFAVQVGSAAGSLTSLALGNAGQALLSNGAGANPSFQNLSLQTVFPWVTTIVSLNMAINTGYFNLQLSGTVVLTLPTVAPTGATIAFANANGQTVNIAQNAGQRIQYGLSTTTPGVAGGLSSSRIGDSVTLVALSSTTWVCTDSMGNINVT